MDTTPFVIERSYAVPASAVWSAITDKEKMKKWYFQLDEFKAEPGFVFTFIGGSPEQQYKHICEVLEAIPNKKLKHSWRYDGYEGNSFVTWELFGEGNNTRVRLTHEGLESFPPLKDFARESFAKGWTFILGTNLKNYLENAA